MSDAARMNLNVFALVAAVGFVFTAEPGLILRPLGFAVILLGAVGGHLAALPRRSSPRAVIIPLLMGLVVSGLSFTLLAS